MSNLFGANQYRSEWTEERTELLKQLWAKGLSCSQIAAELSGDISRNAVIGKAHRLKLDRRAPSPAPKRKREKLPKLPATPPAGRTHANAGNPSGWNGKVRPTPPVAPVAVMEAIMVDTPKPVHILDRDMRKECAWPLWANRHDVAYSDLLCCGNPIAPGEPSYCECHLSVSLRRAA
jgi:GcrA cell cycle regulator